MEFKVSCFQVCLQIILSFEYVFYDMEKAKTSFKNRRHEKVLSQYAKKLENSLSSTK